jgi:large subunit ribosomal protein L18
MPRTTRELRKRRHARVRRLVTGTAARPRVAIFRSHKHISAQVIDDVTGTTLAAASSTEPSLRHVAGATVPGARDVAALLATRMTDKGITTVVFDRGGFLYHGRVAAFADALRAGGLEF